MPEETELKTAAAPLSYLRGADVPLLDLTLSQALSHTAAKFPNREALVVCHEGVRVTWAELDREVTRIARGLAGLGPAAGRPAGIWASNCLEWVLLQYARGARRRGAGQRQSRVPIARTALRAAQVAHARPVPAREGCARRTIARSWPNRATAGSLPLEHIVWLGDPSWDAMLAGGTDYPPKTPTAGRCSQHPVHLRHHRLAQRRAAHPSEPAEQRPGDRARADAPRSTTASARPCRSTTASAA